MRNTGIVLLLASAFFATPASATVEKVDVAVDGKGNVTLSPDPVPATGALQHNDHVKWVADHGCHLDVDILDPDPPANRFAKPDDHGHSEAADVDVPQKNHVGKRKYKYRLHISCDTGEDGTIDPEIVVAGVGFHHHNKRAVKGGGPDYPPVVNIDIKLHGNMASVPSPVTVHIDQRVHWHATGGKLKSLHFVDASAGDVPCANNDCDRSVANLTIGGTYKYVVVIYNAEGKEQALDPDIVIAGGQPRLNSHHKRLAKQ